MKYFDHKAFIFDMDGVLINSMEYHCLAWKEASKLRGLDISDEEVYLHEGEKGLFSAIYFLKQNNMDSSIVSAQEYLKDKERIFSTLPSAKVYPYVDKTLDYLSSNKHKLALVTGTSYDELKKTLPDNIFDYFPIKITGDRVKHGKPDPEPYLIALDQLKINPQDAVVIENAPYGIKSAKAANIYCIAVSTSLSKIHLKEADLIVDSMEEFYKLLSSSKNRNC